MFRELSGICQDVADRSNRAVVVLALAVVCFNVDVHAQSIDPVSDWAQRSAGSLYAENFDYSSTAALISAAAQVNGNITQYMSLETEHTLSGKGVRIGVPANGGGNTGSWNNFINGQNDTTYKRFFLQFVMYADEHWLNYPYKQNNGQPTSPKVIIIDQWNDSYNPGEVVVTTQNDGDSFLRIAGRTQVTHPFSKKSRGMTRPVRMVVRTIFGSFRSTEDSRPASTRVQNSSAGTGR